MRTNLTTEKTHSEQETHKKQKNAKHMVNLKGENNPGVDLRMNSEQTHKVCMHH